MDADDEFDRQVRTLVSLGYAELAGVEADDLALRFLPVVKAGLVPTVAAVERWSVRGRRGWTDMADELDDYRPSTVWACPTRPSTSSTTCAPAGTCSGYLRRRRSTCSPSRVAHR